MHRLGVTLLLLVCACPSSPPDAADAPPARADARPAATGAAFSDGAPAPAARASDAEAAPVPDAGAPDLADAGEAPRPERIALRVVAEGEATPRLDLRGLPAVSADGMHLALLVGDAAHGPLSLRVTRIDGKVVLDSPLLYAGELARGGEAKRAAKLARHLGARVATVERALAAGRFTPLAPVPLQGARLGLVADGGGRLTARLPGFVERAFACPDGAPPTAQLVDGEHGLVVARCGDWQVLALTPRP